MFLFICIFKRNEVRIRYQNFESTQHSTIPIGYSLKVSYYKTICVFDISKFPIRLEIQNHNKRIESIFQISLTMSQLRKEVEIIIISITFLVTEI